MLVVTGVLCFCESQGPLWTMDILEGKRRRREDGFGAKVRDEGRRMKTSVHVTCTQCRTTSKVCSDWWV